MRKVSVEMSGSHASFFGESAQTIQSTGRRQWLHMHKGMKPLSRWRRKRRISLPSSSVLLRLVWLACVLVTIGMSCQLSSFLPDVVMYSYTAETRSLASIPKKKTLLPRVTKSTKNEGLVNRTLVIVLGDLRCGEVAWNTLYENVLDHNNADLALFTQPPPQKEYRNATMFDRAMHIEMVPNYTDWAEALDLVDGPGWRDRVGRYYSSYSHPSLLGGVKGFKASGAIVNMYKWFAAQRILERDWLTQYNRFMVTRTDQYYDCPLDLASMDPDYLWVPEGEDYGGITDRFLVASSDFVVPALDTISPFLKNPEEYRWDFRTRFLVGSFKINCEKYLWYIWEHVGLSARIRRFSRGSYTCMSPVDISRWGYMRERSEDGVNLKYPLEYFATKETCKAKIVSSLSFHIRKWAAFTKESIV